jgi:hypothetical protein
MKKAFILVVTFIIGVTPSYADVYVKVDAQGNAIGEQIVCEADVCGDSNSEYSRLTLNAGESYALQGKGTTGIGNNNTNTAVKVDLQNNDWTVTRTKTIELPEPIYYQGYEITSYETKKVEQFNPYGEVKNPIIKTPYSIDTETAIAVIDTFTFTNEPITTLEDALAYIQSLLNQIYALFEKLGIKGYK